MNIQGEYLAIYRLRGDGDHDLWCVFTRALLEEDPFDIEGAKDENLSCVWGDIIDFPDVWDGSFDD